MAITYVEKADVVASGSPNAVINKPAGTAENDFMVVFLVNGNPAATWTMPDAGWQNQPTLSTHSGVVGWAWKIATASEPATYQFTASVTNDHVGSIATFRGVDTAAPINASSTTALANPPSSSVTPTVTDCMLFTAAGLDGVGSGAFTTSPAMTPISTFGDGTDGEMGSFRQLVTTAQQYTRAFVETRAGAYRQILLALKPSAAVTPTANPNHLQSSTNVSQPTTVQIHVTTPNSLQSTTNLSQPIASVAGQANPNSLQSGVETSQPTLIQQHFVTVSSLQSTTNISQPTATESTGPFFFPGAQVETPMRIGPFADANGNIYIMAEDTEASPTPRMAKSTDGGQNWTQISTGEPTQTDWESADVVQDGHTLHIGMNEGGQSSYHIFNMSSHPTNPDTWVLTDDIIATGYTLAIGQQGFAMERRSDGTIVAFYNRTTGTEDKLFYRVRQPYVWASPSEIQGVLNTGPAWDDVVSRSDETNAFSATGINTPWRTTVLASAIRGERNNDNVYRDKVVTMLNDATGTAINTGAQALDVGGWIPAAVASAQIINLRTYNPTAHNDLITWLGNLMSTTFTGGGTGSLETMATQRGNNWAPITMAGLIAARTYRSEGIEYLIDACKEILGETDAPGRNGGLGFGDKSWQPDNQASQDWMINPTGSTSTLPNSGGSPRDTDGVPADDQRRQEGTHNVDDWPPWRSQDAGGNYYPYKYAWAAAVLAWMLHRRNYPAYQWGNQSLARLLTWHENTTFQEGVGMNVRDHYNGEADGLPHLVNTILGTSFIQENNGSLFRTSLSFADVWPNATQPNVAQGTWSDEFVLDDETGWNHPTVTCVRGANDKLHIFYHSENGSTGTVYHRSLAADGTLSARELVSNTGQSNNFDCPFTEAIYWDDAGNEKIMVCFNNGSGDLHSSVVTNDGTPEASKLAFTGVAQNPGTYNSRQTIASLSADGSTAHVVCADAATLDIWHTENPNNGTWTSATEIEDNVSTYLLRGRVIVRSGTKEIGYMFDQDINGFDGNSWYNTLSLAPPPITANPNNLQSSSNISQPTLTQQHIVIPDALQSSANISQPVLTQQHIIAPNNIQSATNISQVVLVQTHVLTSNSLQSATNISQGTLTQQHIVSISSLESSVNVSEPTATSLQATPNNLQSAVNISQVILTQQHIVSVSSLQSSVNISQPTATETAAFQNLPPIIDLFVGDWRTDTGASTNLFAAIDEPSPPIDTDYIFSKDEGSSSPVTFQTDAANVPSIDTGHKIVLRGYKTGPNTITITPEWRVGTYLNESQPGILIHTGDPISLTATTTTFEVPIPEAAVATITDFQYDQGIIVRLIPSKT